MSDIIMPRLSDTMEEGVISVWLKQVGDTISRGDILAEIETDKALMELEAYDDGVLEQILVEAGCRVPIGRPIAVIGDGSAPSDANRSTEVAEEAAGPRERIRSSPLARKIARELGVDLATVTGTGTAGRIIRRDVESAHRTSAPAAEASPVATSPPVPTTRDSDEVPLSHIQQVSARRLVESKQQAPHIYLTSAIDVTDLFAFRGELNGVLAEAGKGKVSVNDLLVKAVAMTLRAEPMVNVTFAAEKLLLHRSVDLGVAVATPAGLLVPVIRDADRKSLSELAAENRDKAERARSRKLRADEMTGGTFTISNLGMYGVEQFAAVINPPESAILAVGAAGEELRLDDARVTARQILRVTLSADHRAIDGAVAARFLSQLKELLEHPLRIVT